MTITVASGKGGTGKTLISTSLALSLEDEVQLLDCDVEEPNSYIFLKPKLTTAKRFIFPNQRSISQNAPFAGYAVKRAITTPYL